MKMPHIQERGPGSLSGASDRLFAPKNTGNHRAAWRRTAGTADALLSAVSIPHFVITLRANPMSAWQPIETAPKDGTMILAFNAAHRDMAVVGWSPAEPNIAEAGWTDVGSQNRGSAIWLNENYFQFWMPLPEPPAP